MPDAIGYIGENKIFIEFAFTHYIYDNKAEKLKILVFLVLKLIFL